MFALMAPTFVRAEIIAIKQFDELLMTLKDADKKTMVLMDVDYVLIQPKNPLYQMGTFFRYSTITRNVTGTMTREEKDLLMNKIFSHNGVEIMPGNILKTFNAIKRKATVFGFVSTLTGKIGNVKSNAEVKLITLSNLGFNFHRDLSKTTIPYTTFPKHFENYPMWNKGVLFTNGEGNSKKNVLQIFLKGFSTRYKSIIIVDDKRANLEAMEDMLKKHFPELKFTGIHSMASNQHPKEMPKDTEFESALRTLSASVKGTIS